jgi:hypothetical protein
MAKGNGLDPTPFNFGVIPQSEVPQGRRGKHHATIERIMSDLEQLAPNRAMKIELALLPDSKENVRSALNRETRLRGIRISTSSDEHFLYVWRENGNSNGAKRRAV